MVPVKFLSEQWKERVTQNYRALGHAQTLNQGQFQAFFVPDHQA